MDFDKELFWQAMKEIKKDYHIRQTSKPSARSAKRIIVLTICAYFKAGGEVHWVPCLESALYRCCKEKNLECDRLAMEDNNMPYTCKRKGHRDFGRRLSSNQFDEFSISTTEGDYPKARTFAEYLTDFLLLEVITDEQDISRSSERAGVVTDFRHQKRGIRGTTKKRLAIR